MARFSPPAARLIASFADIAPRPWANGAGETTELVALADSAGLTPDRRRWRLSIARLEKSGPFSSLPGVERTFLPTAEVVLTIDGAARRAGPGRFLRFDGAAEVVLTQLREPCFAVNLMVEHGRGPDPLPPLRMHPAPSTAPRLALTLAADERWGRFDLLDLADTSDAPDHLGVIGFD